MPPRRRDPTPLTITFGRAVRELRLEQNLSQEALGERGGLHRNYVGMIERGETNPTLEMILRVSRALGIRASAIVSRVERELR